MPQNKSLLSTQCRHVSALYNCASVSDNIHPTSYNCSYFLHRNKFVEFDMKPVCKKCYEKFPLELKKRLKKLSDTVARK